MKYKIKLFYSAQDGGWIAVWKDGDDTVSAFGDTPDEALHEFADALYLFRNSNWLEIMHYLLYRIKESNGFIASRAYYEAWALLLSMYGEVVELRCGIFDQLILPDKFYRTD